MINQSNTSLDQNEIELISEFENHLERIFSTETKIIIGSSDDDNIRLSIEIDSSFSLSEIISFFKIPFENLNPKAHLGKIVNQFEKAVYTLNKSLPAPLDINELSMYFRNTSITIHSIERNSIMEEINTIATNIIKHFDHYSTIMGSVPNEIHIPVVQRPSNKELLSDKSTLELPISYTSPYSLFWGVYFDYLQHPLIYNLKATNITPGDLDLSYE